MPRFLQSAWFQVTVLYSRFQTFVLTIFVIGILDFMVYSDAILALMAIPELTPIVIIGLLIFGLVKHFFFRKSKRREP